MYTEKQREELKKRLMKKVDLNPNGCWDWLGSWASNHYGTMTFLSHSLYTHRASWIAYKGEIPTGLCVLHTCDNRCCINPEHLFLGTYADNIHDMIAKGRDQCNNGAILTEDEVLQIKKLLAGGLYSQREIGEMFGVSRGAVLGIHREDNWKHLWQTQ